MYQLEKRYFSKLMLNCLLAGECSKIESLVNASIYEAFELVAEGRNIVYLKYCSCI